MALSGSSQNLKRKLDTAGLDQKDDDRRDRCYKCGGRGHQQKECFTDPKAGNELSCYKCQGKGHFARSCPNLTRDVCYFCGAMGHHGLDCPMLTRMFGNLPAVKRKELMSKMHSNPQFASQIMREAGTSPYTADPYGGLLSGGSNPLQALMSLLQAQQSSLQGLGGPQPSLYANPYNQQSQSQPGQHTMASQYPGYPDTSSSVPSQSYSAYGAVPSPTGSSGPSNSGGYSAPPTMYSQPNFGTDVLSTLRALQGGQLGGYGAGLGSMGYGAPSAHGGHGGGSNCFKCGQAGHFARECPNAPSDGGILCYRCGQSGHMAKDCANAPTSTSVAGSESCFRCGERGHFSRDCVKNGAIPSKDSCFRCGQPGHRTRECTGPDIRVCFVCKQSGHVSGACPDRTAR